MRVSAFHRADAQITSLWHFKFQVGSLSAERSLESGRSGGGSHSDM